MKETPMRVNITMKNFKIKHMRLLKEDFQMHLIY